MLETPPDRLHRRPNVVGLGAWQLGADWGEVSEDDALAVLAAAVRSGVDFVDTADVYGDGRSEQLVGRFLREHPDSGVTVGHCRIEPSRVILTADSSVGRCRTTPEEAAGAPGSAQSWGHKEPRGVGAAAQ